MDDNLVPVLGMLLIFGLPVGGWIAVRLIQHRERMEMLRRGIVPPPDMRAWRRGRGVWAPPPWTQAGPMPTGAPAPGYAPYIADDDPNSPQCTLHGGIKVAMVGLALLIGLSFIGYRGGDGLLSPPSIHPGPWLLGGLIPMFVGIAQIIIALLSGATFGTRLLPPPGPSGPPPGQTFYESPQPGRPGPRYEELARPVPPPDRP
jgi:hypothetical protein